MVAGASLSGLSVSLACDYVPALNSTRLDLRRLRRASCAGLFASAITILAYISNRATAIML
jgi:hypothetical protein